ncbi:hypothetical protein D2E25_0239 [Bifidobacterium goeldii]|uniref:Uncharacterized protein n=1 Tax=Bifidobacterium goeldii TaxID=2306975 RepID=A0A430FLY7_9BIFI|nr:hypothetical protein [Bifidobacterium goeldii]RSX53933.1 hypothetical protein D2E25_0239 [Bifidobacterium goeldii]
MAVLEKPYARGDFSFPRGMDFSWQFNCQRSIDGGKTTNPLDLSGITVRVRLLDLADNILLDKPVAAATATGQIIATLTASDTNSSEWQGRRRGVWQIYGVQPDGEALSCTWTGANTTAHSIMQSIPDLESGKTELYGWGYWNAF